MQKEKLIPIIFSRPISLIGWTFCIQSTSSEEPVNNKTKDKIHEA